MERMQAIIAGIPYDNFNKENLKLREQNYQTAVYLIFRLMGQFVQTEIGDVSKVGYFFDIPASLKLSLYTIMT